MFCENCGAKLSADAKFCTECGTKVAAAISDEKPIMEEKQVIEEKQVVEPVKEKDASKSETLPENIVKDEAATGIIAAGGAVAGAAVTVATEKAVETAEVKPEALATANEEILRIGANKGKKNETISTGNIPPRSGSGEQGNTSGNQPQQQDKSIFQEYFEEIQKFNCAGRLNRLKYWKFIGVNFIFVFIVTTVLTKLGLGEKVLNIFSLIMSILFVPFSVRRLHDLNKNGLFLLLAFVPVINFFFIIYMWFFKGTEGPNQYGEDPLAKIY